MPTSTPPNIYLWCDHCRRSFKPIDAPDNLCPICKSEIKPVGKFNAILRGLMANELNPSPIVSKHRQLVKLIWTRNGAGEEYFRLLAPDMSYAKFEIAMTNLLCRGAEEGWVTFSMPPAPVDDEGLYMLKVNDENRFLNELQTLAGPDAALEDGD